MTTLWQTQTTQDLSQPPNPSPQHLRTCRSNKINNRHTTRFTMAKESSAPMKRILIIGSSGSGKSTLARQLGASLNLPVIHLDKLFWHPGWVGTPPTVWTQTVAELTSGNEWIIDGNYRGTLDMRLASADTVVFLDLPRLLCSWRVTKRRFQYMNRQRPDIAKGCQEKVLDPNFPKFLRWVWNYPNRARPTVLRKLQISGFDKQFIWLRSTADVQQFVKRPLQWPTTIASLNILYEVAARFDG